MARSPVPDAGGATALVEIVRRLNRLDRLESLRSPFALADARSVLADWDQGSCAAATAGDSAPNDARAA